MKRTLLLAAAVAVSLSGCTWLKSLGKKDNVQPPTELVEFAPTTQVDRVWSEGVGSGAGASGARLAPGVADGRLYAAGVDGSIEAIDATTGRTLWHTRLGERHGWRFWSRRDNSLRWSGGPTAEGDLVVVGGLDGQVYALSAADGSERWKAQMSSEIVAAPAIANGIVVVRSNDGRLVGLDAADGSRKWIFDQSVPALSLRSNSAPLIANGVVYDGYDNGRVVAVRLDDGNELWSQTLSGGEGRTEVERLADVDGNIVSDGQALYAAGYRGQLAAIALDSGRPVWQRDLSSYTGTAVSGNTLVAIDADGNVWAFDRETGVNLWKQDQLKYRWLTAPAIQGKYVVVGDIEGYVHWLSLDEGKFAARERLSRKPIEGAPLVVGDLVYVEDVKGHIGAYRARQ
ncbi:outer membrane protein assembly factor BamB [Dokdonella fugitiva]|uniref:Outer membrane protein assembly factor BamB n=1 Tax=Dokdonella fugitiva TaxID=328517 RepID=A0A839EX25_9GAMM|nr:outer membrane protein assembly factor BamB [Dokdonella fugitiva]MBA8886259.1 outer membrane protein assembly factor BamB [Dokdonella fugitiva]